jgi:hypothetical protein
MKPRPLTEREQTLIDLYGYCQLGMTPQQFYAKWQVNQEAIAFICDRSMSTVRRWFKRGGNYRRPRPADLRHLARRRRNDAEEHLRILRRLLPGASFAIAFDPAMERQDSSDEGE